MGIHQEIMDKAYVKFGNVGYAEFVDSLDEKEGLAVLAGNLNYQVGNGGFYQWYSNEYNLGLNRLVDLLEKYGDGLQTFRELKDILISYKELEEAYIEEEYEEEYEDEYDEGYEERFSDGLRHLDGLYRDMEDNFLKEVEKVLSSM